ncbi:hypothetical protein [Botrimarina hoheduenensis]|uniref:DUF4350 domain-containing protein n=1 Tax=Botrimarina hoheduenensis TaxID=2528000 RepID=A0A5C5WED5_9BACT|nr:hypothetical protein [Botrimarina hoheduenensis]TWT48513.1 hypothetical protein Pla111_02830 [Botrimarina hoheduenensis]
MIGSLAEVCLAFVMRIGAVVAIAASTALPGGAADLAGPRLESVRVGLGGKYKLGAVTPLEVRVAGGAAGTSVRVVALAPDNDGLRVVTVTPPLTLTGAEPQTVRLPVWVGKPAPAFEIRLLATEQPDAPPLDRAEFSTGGLFRGELISNPLPAATRLLLSIGPDVGLDNLQGTASKVARLINMAELPSDPLVYDAFETVLLTAGLDEAWRSADQSAESEQIAALDQWVRDGGRLVISCGRDAATLLSAAGPWSVLAPGELDRVVPLRSTAALESYAGDGTRLSDADQLVAARLTNSRGVVSAYEGPTREALPLVIRAPHGFGEVVFLAVDLDDPALTRWDGRAALLRKLIDPPAAERSRAAVSPLGSKPRGESDLVDEAIRVLGAALPQVSSVSVLAVLAAAGVYLVLIGPLDWWFVNRALQRPQATWLTFPLIAAAVGLAVYAGGQALRGEALKIAAFEICDSDRSADTTRGLLLSQIYSPKSRRYDIEVAETAATRTKTWWLATTGGRLGGLASRAALSQDTYALEGSSVRGLPLVSGSTKTLVTRWHGPAQPLITADLTRAEGGLVEGQITNPGNHDLSDCHLLAGGWAWRLGTLARGQSKPISDSGNLLRITTLLSRQLEAAPADPRSAAKATAAILSFGELLSQRTTIATNRLFAANDLSHHLEAGRAIVIGVLDDPATSVALEIAGESIPADCRWRTTFVRCLVEVD